MDRLKIKPLELKERHYTHGIKIGDWIIYACKKCNYIRRYNVVTSETIEFGSKAGILHSGIYKDPDEFNFNNYETIN